jgi:predicted nuclease of predicted toxin-antitoxin system
MDVHVPAAITRGLLLTGVDVLTAQLDGTTQLEDPGLLDRATELGRVLFSQDDDLLRLRGGTAILTASRRDKTAWPGRW